ncbi:MAG: hypothetical protein M0P76_01285 [Candidatus Pacebacteria bacterium]|jgi:diadenosine tetraphosphate (Ap4A) HIT family hydrolase|nr:hypothetical protein [Candidatus Paceibacterota bacterium]
MRFRKKRTLDKYHAYRKNGDRPHCDFCVDEPQNKKYLFAHWKILKNMFPYDMIADFHDLIVPRRHFQCESEMTAAEREELVYLKTEFLPKGKKYDIIWENFAHMRSVDHYHVHILRFKK